MKIVLKDPNEVWKYLNFFFSCMKGLGPEKEAFRGKYDSP